MAGGSPTIVQGVYADPYGNNPTQQTTTSPSPMQMESGTTHTKGERQPTKCNDPIFAVLFYCNLIAIVGVVATYGTTAFGETTGNLDYTGYMYSVFITGAVAICLSFLMLLVMMRIPTLLIKISLIFTVAMSGVWAIIAFITGNIVMGVLGLIFFALSVCYAYFVWERIPFASVNLLTATTSIKNNCGVTIIAIFFVFVAFAWSLLWAVALLSIWDQTNSCSTDAQGKETCSPNYIYFFFMFLSYFFTHQVIQNTVHVIVAGVVGTWWFSPENGSYCCCCSRAILDSTVRAMTTSFGSICLGSLIVAIIQALKQMAHQARQGATDTDGAILACIAECILGCLESIVEYFNKWAFIYVGLYGYTYLQAGKNVFELFRNRGWDAIIADDLVGNTLLLVSIVVGGLSGVAGIVLEQATTLFTDAGLDSTAVAFLLGFVVGVVLCSIFMSTIASAVNAVIVLFAEAPAEFQQNYPELSEKMQAAWLTAYPGCM